MVHGCMWFLLVQVDTTAFIDEDDFSSQQLTSTNASFIDSINCLVIALFALPHTCTFTRLTHLLLEVSALLWIFYVIVQAIVKVWTFNASFIIAVEWFSDLMLLSSSALSADWYCLEVLVQKWSIILYCCIILILRYQLSHFIAVYLYDYHIFVLECLLLFFAAERPSQWCYEHSFHILYQFRKSWYMATVLCTRG